MNMIQEKPNDIGPQGTGADRDVDIDPRWYALASETLSETETETLRTEAEASAEGRALWELYQPADAHVKERLFEGVYARVQAEPESPHWIAAFWRDLPRIWRVSTPLALSFALLAAVFVPLQLARDRVEVAWSEKRGLARWDAPVLDAPAASLTLTIVPKGSTRGPLVVRGALLVHDGQAHPWPVHENQPGDDGTLVITGEKKALFPCVPSGEWELLVAVGRPGEAPAASEMMRLAGQGSAGAFQVLAKRLVLGGATVDAGGLPCRGSAF